MKIWKEIYQYRQMIFSLVKKDLRGRYKGSVLGFLWTFINPLMQLVVYTFVFTYIMKAGIPKYSICLWRWCPGFSSPRPLPAAPAPWWRRRI